MVRDYYFGNSVPVDRTHLTIKAPETLPLRYKTALLPDVAVRGRSENGVHRLDFDQGPMKAIEDRLPLLPPDEARQARVAFSTARSWQAVAAEYSGHSGEADQRIQWQLLFAEVPRGRVARCENPNGRGKTQS
jgi:hypothetical protein